MRPPHLLGFALICLAGLTLAACHHRRRGGPTPFEQACTKSCQRVASCEESVDVDECEEACLNRLAPLGEHLRKEFYDEFNQCIADARCSDLGVTAFDNECRGVATDRIGVNLKAIKLCEAVTEMLDRCGGGVGSADPKPCQQSMKIFDDTTLSAATECRAESCHDIGKCFTESLGVLPGPMEDIASE